MSFIKSKNFIILIIAVFIWGCAAKKQKSKLFSADVYMNGTYSGGIGIATISDTLILNDSSGRRNVPIKAYWEFSRIAGRKLVILNPGYGGKSTDYSYIARMLAKEGYFVVTIQHDLPTDTIPSTDIYKLRKTLWERGVKNIFVVDNEMRVRYPSLNFKHTILIGYSNGGDIALFMAKEYPLYAKTIITLDNLRVPFPRSGHPKILSIRSSDQTADPGVLPTAEEQRRYDIKIVHVNTTHNDMGGAGTDAQKKEINNYILDFLNNN
jgi:hypothetical protein